MPIAKYMFYVVKYSSNVLVSQKHIKGGTGLLVPVFVGLIKRLLYSIVWTLKSGGNIFCLIQDHDTI